LCSIHSYSDTSREKLPPNGFELSQIPRSIRDEVLVFFQGSSEWLGRFFEMSGVVSLLACLHKHLRPIPLATLRASQMLLVGNLKAGEVSVYRNLEFMAARWATIGSIARVPSCQKKQASTDQGEPYGKAKRPSHWDQNHRSNDNGRNR
jgi:hypothetical protein